MLLKLRWYLLFILLIGGVVACEGDDGSEDTPVPPAPTPTVLDDSEESLSADVGPSGPSFIGNAPLPSGFRAFDGITIVEQNILELSNAIVVSMRVRNDSDNMIPRMETLVTLLDSDGIRLRSDTRLTAQGNVAVGDTISITNRFGITDLPAYDGAYVIVQAARSDAAEVNATAVLGTDVETEVLSEESMVRGTARNPTDRPLLTPVVHFIYYDNEDNLIMVTSGGVVAGLEDDIVWRPDTALTLEAMLPTVPEGVTIDRVELEVIGYDYAAFEG